MNPKILSASALRVVLSLFMLGLIVQTAHGQGGPPMITDDPGTPGNNNWEINLLPALEHTRGRTTWEAPEIDVNYGVGRRMQLRYEVPYVVRQDGAGTLRGGVGNSAFGIKWRLIDERHAGFSMSVYPSIEFSGPRSSVRRDLAVEGTRWFLPIEAVKEMKGYDLNAEVGYLVEHDGDNSWEFGVVAGHEYTDRIEAMAELHASTPRDFTERNLIANFGSRIKVNNQMILLLSAGRSIRNPGAGTLTIASAGLQLNFIASPGHKGISDR